VQRRRGTFSKKKIRGTGKGHNGNLRDFKDSRVPGKSGKKSRRSAAKKGGADVLETQEPDEDCGWDRDLRKCCGGGRWRGEGDSNAVKKKVKGAGKKEKKRSNWSNSQKKGKSQSQLLEEEEGTSTKTKRKTISKRNKHERKNHEE